MSRILPIRTYGDPILREPARPVAAVTPEIREFVDNLFATMHAAQGVGLAAQQVGIPLQLTVIDVRGATDRPSTLELDGKPADPNEFMPLVLINPEVKPLGDPVAGPEGCLSFPEIFADITRPESVEVRAINEKGKPIQFRCGGLLARAVQHEIDHLHGILFIDRMDKTTKADPKEELEALQEETKAARKKKLA